MTTGLSPVTYGSVPAGVTGFVIIPRGVGTVNVYNGDITNVLLLSKNPSPSASNSLPVQPLTNATVDATDNQWYGAGSGAAVANVTVSSASQLSPSPAQIAQQINALGLAKDTTLQITNTNTSATATNTTGVSKDTSVQTLGGVAGRSIATDMLNANKGVTTELAALVATGSAAGAPGGVPLLRGTKALNSGTASIAGAGNSILVNNVVLTQPGFEATFIANLPAAAGTIPFVQIQFQWVDNATSSVMETKNYFVTAGNGPSATVTTYINGPCYANKLLVTAFNLDPAQTLTLGFIVNQTADIYEHDHELQAGYPSANPITFANPNGFPSAGILAQSNPSIGPNGSIQRLMASFKGQAIINVDNGGQANIARVALEDPNNIYGGGVNFPQFNDTIAAGARAHFPVYLPGGPLLLHMFNTQATNTITLGVTVMCLDI